MKNTIREYQTVVCPIMPETFVAVVEHNILVNISYLN